MPLLNAGDGTLYCGRCHKANNRKDPEHEVLSSNNRHLYLLFLYLPFFSHFPSKRLKTFSFMKQDPPASFIILDHDSANFPANNVSHLSQDASPDLSVNQQTTVYVSLAEADPTLSRSASVTSSLDPYYFGSQSPSLSPVPPLPPVPGALSPTPDYLSSAEPITPAKNPASIDRRGLVGVGELTTPRWVRTEQEDHNPLLGDKESYEVVASEVEGDEPDSPWTIEAVDGESSEKDELVDLQPRTRPFRMRPSVAEESGGEEILYPRKFSGPVPDLPALVDTYSSMEQTPKALRLPVEPSNSMRFSSPPSAYAHSVRKAKKRSSDEFEMDQFGILVSKQTYSDSSGKDGVKDDKNFSRKHRSLNVSTSSSLSSRDTKGKDRKRGSTSISLVTSPKSSPSKNVDKHARQVSVGSMGSQPADGHPSRRVQTTDFSHLPPASLQAQVTSKGSNQPHSFVAHSVLRGPQEGWSELDDEATAEALRKLDGLSGKTARARASVGSLGRASGSSRPPTPAGKSAGQWEGISSTDSSKGKRTSSRDTSFTRDKDRDSVRLTGISKPHLPDYPTNVTSSDEQQIPSHLVHDKTPRKTVTNSARSSFTTKRGSTSSTNYTSTPTTSSRDSATVSVSTSITSVSATSGRHSTGKPRRNSAGSDNLHFHEASSLKDRAACLAGNGDVIDESVVPPVPPLPKDLSSYRSPPPSMSSLTFPSVPHDDSNTHASQENMVDHVAPSTYPQQNAHYAPVASSSHRQHQPHSSGYISMHSAPEPAPAAPKTPSKKWSFSALNIKLTGSPALSKPAFPLSPRSVTFGSHSNSKHSKEPNTPIVSPQDAPWSPEQPGAMDSQGSLASLSSVGSVHNHILQTQPSKTPDGVLHSRSGTASSASTNHATSALTAPSGPLSPSTSMRRSQSRRLTPSSIPFFRRSSSQSMQLPPPVVTPSSPSSSGPGPRPSSNRRTVGSPSRDQSAHTAPSSAQKKSSVLSLGFPSLLKSSSRRSLLSDSRETIKENSKSQNTPKQSSKERAKQAKQEKDRQKKEEKDRSESRISILMNGGRRRGKTLSSVEPRKLKSPVSLPPIQVPALEQATAQRVARLQPNTGTAGTAGGTSITSRSTSTSRVTSQSNTMQKPSDTSLQNRVQLPTIAGSPSVGTTGASKDSRDASASNSAVAYTKETPTKIPRISSRTSTAASPTLKSSTSARRTSTQTGGPASSSANPSPIALAANEFGVIEMDNVPQKTGFLRQSVNRTSPSNSSRLPRQTSASISATNLTAKRANRDSVSYTSVRKPSTSSITSLSTPAASTEMSSRRLNAFSPSKSLKLLSPKISLSSARGSNATIVAQNVRQGSPSSSRQIISTPSPAPSSVDDDETIGDEEMMQYIKRQHAKKIAAGATQEELDKLLQFPEPIPPGIPSSPTAFLQSSRAKYLSEYERKEMLDYPSVYFIGEHSRKNQAVLDNPANNYGYDDDRGDYLVVNRDHLAYRYEVIDTLGKGSFGQVLHCRDHCTGESVAIKIIRNKKRFHHQALVEIRILDKLRTWDSEEKHHVIKMTEHFYFRNHLCIAMELLSINLYELIKANGFVGFTTALIRRFTSQMLMSLSLMRQYRIVHCDLKPENVLLRHPAKSAIKVIDFGSSCFENEKIYTYIQSRFYRSPEVILGMNYHMAIDMWSLGCILAELYTGFPIFPGENEQEQLSCIMEVLGIPEKDFVNRSTRKKLFFEANGTPRVVVNSKGRRRRPGTKSLAQVLKCNDEEFVDFISKCLVWDPERRMKPQAALRHPFVTAGRKPKVISATITSKLTASTSSLSGNRNKQVTETPKKSMISAPTPLTARSSRTATGPTTPSNSSHSSTLGSSRSYRTSSHSHGVSSYHSSRTLGGFSATVMK